MTKPTTEARRHGEESGDLAFEDAAGICHPERVGACATASRRIPTKFIPARAASGSSHETLPPSRNIGLYQGTGFSRAVKGKLNLALAREVFGKVMHTFRAALREIFDESAYDRFLLRTHAFRSVGSYRAFMLERDADMVKKPRCC